MEFGTILANLRKQKDLSQRQFADILGVSNGAIAMWETNKRQPDIDMLKKIATFLGVSIDYLVDYQETFNYDSNDKEEVMHPLSSSDAITTRERQLIETFRQLDDDYKDIAIGEIKRLLKEQHLIESKSRESLLKKIT